jgi:hypothetical protein
VARPVLVGQPLPVTPATPAVAPRPLPAAGGNPPAAVRPTNALGLVPAASPMAVPAAAPRPIPVPKRAGGELVIREKAQEEADPEEQIKKLALKNAPPWLISTLIHMLIMIILGVWLLPNDNSKNAIFLDVIAEQIGEQLDDESVMTSTENKDLDKQVLMDETRERVDDPFAAPPKVDVTVALPGVSASADVAAPVIGLLWSGRDIGSKEAMLSRYGGTKQGEDAVVQGLQWLVKQQRKDGSWSLKGPYSSPSLEPRDVPESATAMALLAFQGHGSTHKKGPFQKTVARGARALLELQQKDGSFFDQDGGGRHNWLYTHAQCTIAVCELYGMTHDDALRKPAELAVRVCVESQDPELGGWRYSPRIDSDTSVTGWMVIALQSAKMAGLDVPSTTWEKLSEYLDKATFDGSHYGYQAGMEPTVSMTAEGLLCRQFLGWRQDDPRLVEGAEFLLKHLPSWEDRDVYYWYYATQTMHHMEGKYWTAWNAAFRDNLIESRETKGQEKGSWDPLGKNPDRWASLGQGGRLYVTCLSLYMLEVYYRHLPIYEMRKMNAK